MMQRIVVGTDGSPSSMAAVQQAAELAAATRAQLHIACAVRSTAELVGMSVLVASVPGSWDEEAQAQAAAAVARAARVAQETGASAQGHVVSGEPANALISLCEEVDADLLVVGSRGMTGAARFLLGSVRTAAPTMHRAR